MNPSSFRPAGSPNPGRAARTPAAAIAWTSVVMLLLVGLVALDLYRVEAVAPDAVVRSEQPAPARNSAPPERPTDDALPEELPSTF